MSCCELEFACLIPKPKPEQLLNEPYISYKGTDYKKTLRFRVPSWKPIKSGLKRYWNWLCFVWLHSRSRKCRKVCFLLLFTTLLALFTIICILLPLAFKYSSEFRKDTIFNPTIAPHDVFDKALTFQVQYDTQKFYKPKNIYVTVNKLENVKLGVWDINPNHVQDAFLIFLHGSDGDRRTYTNDYSKLSPYFHIIAFDYRGYGDSTKGEVNEHELVQDSIQLYKWLKSHTNSSIFIWGDTLGAAIAVHTVAELRKEKIFPCGLMLENSYVTMEEHVSHNWFPAKMTWYMPWYKTTIINPLDESDLSFNINKYINNIDSPIGFWEWNEDTAHGKSNNFNVTNNQITRTYVNIYYYSKVDAQLSSDGETFIRAFITDGNDYCKREKHNV